MQADNSAPKELVERLRALLRPILRDHARAVIQGFEHVDIAERVAQAVADQLSSDLSELERMEQIISAWAFAHNIDGAARNDLFKRLRGSGALLDEGEGK